MTLHLDNGMAARANPITMLPRFPAAMLGASLLDVIQGAANGVVIVDAARQIVLVNQRAERIFGYPASFLLDRPLDILLPSGTDGEMRRRVGRLAAPRTFGRRGRIELRGVRADGAPIALKGSITRLSIRGEAFLALIVDDMTLPTLPPLPIPAYNHPPSIPAPGTPTARNRAVSSQQASEMEKRRFSRKLYDDIGQRLSVLKLDLSWLENSLPATNRYVPERLAEMQGLLDNVITLTKSMASTLRPPVLDDFGLLPAVEWMTESFRKRTGIRCELASDGLDEKLDETVESAVFRIIQEGLANIERHSHAGWAWVRLQRNRASLEVEIRDDGVGMEDGELGKPGCYGLIAMQERVFVLGGTIRIENVRPRGLQINVCIPLEPHSPVLPLATP